MNRTVDNSPPRAGSAERRRAPAIDRPPRDERSRCRAPRDVENHPAADQVRSTTRGLRTVEAVTVSGSAAGSPACWRIPVGIPLIMRSWSSQARGRKRQRALPHTGVGAQRLPWTGRFPNDRHHSCRPPVQQIAAIQKYPTRREKPQREYPREAAEAPGHYLTGE